jgi:hypothetical protein
VYSSNREGGYDLYITNADGTGEAQLLTSNWVRYILPDWQPQPSRLHNRDRRGSDPSRRMDSAISDAPWLGLQTDVEDRPLALTEAGA